MEKNLVRQLLQTSSKTRNSCFLECLLRTAIRNLDNRIKNQKLEILSKSCIMFHGLHIQVWKFRTFPDDSKRRMAGKTIRSKTSRICSSGIIPYISPTSLYNSRKQLYQQWTPVKTHTQLSRIITSQKVYLKKFQEGRNHCHVSFNLLIRVFIDANSSAHRLLHRTIFSFYSSEIQNKN